jgi:hypothetical protein
VKVLMVPISFIYICICLFWARGEPVNYRRNLLQILIKYKRPKSLFSLSCLALIIISVLIFCDSEQFILTFFVPNTENIFVSFRNSNFDHILSAYIWILAFLSLVIDAFKCWNSNWVDLSLYIWLVNSYYIEIIK